MKNIIYRMSTSLAMVMLTMQIAYAIPDIDFKNDTIFEHSYGTGIVSINLDTNNTPDYITCYSHAEKSGDDIFKSEVVCYIAKNVNEVNYANSNNYTEYYRLGRKDNRIKGVGVAAGDIDNDGYKDLVIVGTSANQLRYRVAKHLEEDGHTMGYDEKEFAVSSDDIDYVKDVIGLGASLYDLDHNGQQELIVLWSTSKWQDVEMAILWNLNEDGKYDKLTQKTIENDFSSSVRGLGIEMLQLDDNPAPDIYYTYKEGDDTYHQRVLYNINEKGDYTVLRKLDNGQLKTAVTNNSIGMGATLAYVNGDFTYDATIAYPEDKVGSDDDKVICDTFLDSVKSTEKVEKIKTKERIELVKHLGRVVSMINHDNRLQYSVMNDDGSWSVPSNLVMPDSDEGNDDSVNNLNSSQSTLEYNYNHNIELFNPITGGSNKFHLISDGEYIYLFHTNSKGRIYITRYVLDKVTNELVRPYDVRYGRSEQKCTPAASGIDTQDYKNMDGEPFYEPSVMINFFDDKNIMITDFSVHILPTSLPDEERWQIFALDTQGALHELSFRRAIEDKCDEQAKRVYFTGLPSDEDKIVSYTDDNNKSATTTLPGMKYHKFDAYSFPFSGLSSTIYSNQQSCDGKIIKSDQRIKMVLSQSMAKMAEVDYGINSLGLLLPIDKTKFKYEDQGCDAPKTEAYSFKSMFDFISDVTPFIYESVDGKLHLIFSNNDELVEKTYDTLSNKWRYNPSSPWLYYPKKKPYSSPISMEYGTYSYDSDGKLKGEIKRISSYTNNNYPYLYRDKIGDLQMKYIGQNMIDLTLIGYIEGAPPVPQENLTESDDYDDISLVATSEASSLKQTYVQSKDWGLDFESDGNVGPAAFSLDTSYSWLSENSTSYDNVETIGMSQSLKGEWNDEKKVWEPYNIGIALVKGRKANIYGLYLDDGDGDDGNNRLYTYKTIPVPGSEEEHLTSFVINPHYSKNGDLESYKKSEELSATESSIKNRESHIRAYYKQYKSNAFTSIPELDSISKRNIINEYYWSATGGMRSKSTSYSTSMSESLGGSFSFQGMVGISLGDPLFGSYTLNVLAGAHIEKTFSKTEDAENSFELNVEANVESKGVIDGELDPSAAPQTAGASGKVDYFKWKTAYLEPSADNFNDFYDNVVDPEWLQKDNVYSVRLREARNRANKVWRIRHFVTFVSRVYEK